MELQNLKRLQPYLCILAALFVFYILYTYGLKSDTREDFIGGADTAQQIMLPSYITSSESSPMATDPEVNKSHLLIEIPDKVTCNTNEDCNIIYGKGKNQCVGGKCKCTEGTGAFCHKRPNYYKDPTEMTPAQVIKFKKNAKLENMTIGDYKNWLMLFKYDQESLPRYHLRNFQRLMMGQPIYDIPLSDPVEEYFADSAAKKDKITMEIPNAEIDSPLNWKINSQLNNTGKIDRLGNTERPLNWSRYYKYPALSADRFERSDKLTVKDWFLNNINWLFYDVDRNQAYKDPNANRFMNIIGDSRQPQSSYTPQRLIQESGLLPTQEGSITSANNVSNLSSSLDPSPVDFTTGVAGDAGQFVFSGDA